MPSLLFHFSLSSGAQMQKSNMSKLFSSMFKNTPDMYLVQRRVDVVDVMTLNNDRLFRPKLLTAEMSEDAVIRCSNSKCKLKLSINEINKHKFVDFLYRIIKCLATNCDQNNKHFQVHNHALQFPFLKFYSVTCNIAYGAEVLEHSSAIKLKQRL